MGHPMLILNIICFYIWVLNFFGLQFLFELYFFRERNYTLQPTDYIIGPASGNPDLCLTWPRALPPNSDGIDWQMGNFFIFLVSTGRH